MFFVFRGVRQEERLGSVYSWGLPTDGRLGYLDEEAAFDCVASAPKSDARSNLRALREHCFRRVDDFTT